MEAWQKAGYPGLSAWQEESWLAQAKVIAHHIHMRLRESYELEQISSRTGKETPGLYSGEDFAEKMIAKAMGAPPPKA